MKKLITIFILLISCYSFSQEVNPWKSIGKEAPEILTLSDGKYPEIFENDSIRIISGIVYNTITNKVIGFIETDTLYSEATLEPEIVSRWLSRDPLAHKYPDMSPYNFVGNNPIVFIDPNGESIDLSSMTAAQISKYNERIKILKSSEIFAYYYDVLERSDIAYKVQATGRKNADGTHAATGFSDFTNKIVGVGENMDALVVAQELFHAFQYDNYYFDEKTLPYSSIETEGDIATFYVLIQASLPLVSYGDWSDDIMLPAYSQLPNSDVMSSDEYNEDFQEAVDKRIDYYKKQGFSETSSYVQPNQGTKPEALTGAIKGAEKNAMKGWHAPMKMPENQPKEKSWWEEVK